MREYKTKTVVQNQNQNTNVVFPNSNSDEESSSVNFAQNLQGNQALSLDPQNQSIDTPAYGQADQPQPKKLSVFVRLARRADVALAVLLILGSLGLVLNSYLNKEPAASNNAAAKFETTQLPLQDFAGSEGINFGNQSVIINGNLRANDGLIIAPSLQPTSAVAGQMYYDQTSNVLSYYNGSQFVPVGSGVQSVGGLTGQIAIGGGIAVTGGQITNTGVLSVQGVSGNVVLAAGNGISISGTTISNDGVVSIVSNTPSITVVDDGNGNITLGGSGSGTVNSPGGTVGRIPVFTASQTIEDSIISQSGITATVSGDLAVVTGGLTLSNALTVSNGGTGANSLALNGVLIGNGTDPVAAVTAGGPNLCLISTAGAPIFTTCPSAAGVTTLNGQSGAVNVANASGAGGVVTIDNATTSSKGIAQFNGTNFTVVSGAVNTIQNINTTATPTFAGVNTNNITPSGTLTVGSTAQQLTLQGNANTQISATGGGFTTTVNFNGTATGDVVYQFDRSAAAGTYTICTTVGNCSGAAGITGSGSAGAIALFTDTEEIGDSIITQGGSAINIAGSLTLGTALGVGYGGTGVNTTPTNGQLLIGNGSGYTVATLTNAGGVGIANGAGSIGLSILYGSTANTAVQGNTALTCPSGTGNLTGGGTSVTLGAGGTCAALNTINNPTFTTSVTTPLVQNAGLTLEATGANSLQLRTNSATRLTITSDGDLTATGDMTLQGGGLTVGTTTQAGTLTVHDGAGATGFIDIATLSGNQNYTLPDASGEICLTSGNCAGAGGGITGTGTTNQLAKFTGAGTIGDSSISDDGATVTTTGDMVIQGGGLTVGGSGQSGLLVLNDGSGQTTTLQAGNSAGNLTFILPTTAGAATQCLKQSGTGNQLIWDDCEGGTGGLTGVTSLNSLSGGLTIQGTANRVTVSDNGSNTITLSTPQDIATTSSPTFASLTLTGDAAVNGGDITSSGVLNITPSGTLTVGVTGQTLTLQGDASTSLSATSGANTASLVFATPTGDRTITLPDASGTVCLTTGNCAGAGGGVTTAGGTTNTIAMFTGAQAVGDSIITQGSGVVNIAGSLTLGSPLAIAYGGTGIGTAPTNGQLLIGNGTGYQLGMLTNNGGLTVTNGAGSIGLAVNYGSTAGTAVQGNTSLTCPSGTGNLTGGGTAITLGTGGTCATLNTVNNPTFTTSVTTPLVQSAGLTISSTGANSLQLQTNGNTRLTITSGGDLTATGDMTLQGGSLTVGADNQAGAVTFYDGDTGLAAHTGTLQVISSLGQNTTYVLPDPGTGTVSICLTSGNCAGAGGGITGTGTTNQLAKFTGTGTIGDSSISDDGTTVTTTGDVSIQGGALTVGTASQGGTLILNDGGGQTTTLQAGNSAGSLTFILPTNAGTATQCLKQSGTGNQLIWDDCEGGGGGISGVTSLNSLAGALNIQGTTDEILVNSNGTDTLTLSLASAVTLQGNTFNGASQLVQLNASAQLPAVSGALLTDLNGSAITSGTINNTRLTNAGALTVSAGTGLTGGGSVALGGTTTLNVSYGSTAGTAVQGNTQLTVTAGTNLTGGGTVTLGSGGTLTVNVADSPTFAGNVIVQGGSLTVGTASQAGTLVVHDGDGFTGSVATDTLSDDRAYTLPDASGEICLDTGNCASSGGGVTTAGGTAGTIAVFTGTQAIGDSLLSQAAGTITANGHLSLTAGNQYRINGVQISSANLSNDANLAKLNASQTFTGNNNTFRNGANSTSGFSVQRSDGISLLAADTTGGQIVLGTASSLDGKLVFNSAGSANAVTLSAGSLTGSRAITFPDASGVVCLSSGNCAGAGATLQTAYNFSAGGTTPKIKVNSTLGGVDIQDADTAINGNLLSVRASNGSGLGTIMFGVNSAGEVVLQSSANSETALQLLTEGGTSVLTGDTENGRIMLGQANTLTGSLLFSHASSAFVGTLVQGALTDDRTYTLPDASGIVCLTSGNCAGSAGGVTTVGGTTNRLSVFTGAQTIGDAWLNQNTTTLELDNTRNLSLLGGNLSVAGNITASGTYNTNTFTSSSLQFGAAGTATVSSAASQALNITSNAAATWSTSNGNLIITAQGNLNLGVGGGQNINIGTNNAAHTIIVGNQGATGAQSITIGSSGNAANAVSIESGSSGTINVGNSATAHTINIGNGAAAQSVTLGSTNSTSATLIQGGSGNITLATSDGNRVQVGSSTTDATAVLLTVDSFNNGTDPTGTNGSMYYNTSTNAFRCYQAGAWMDCITASGGFVSLQNAYTNSTGGTTPEIKLDGTRGALDIQDANTTIGANLFNVRASNGSGLGDIMFGVGNTGAILAQNTTDSAAAFQIQNAADDVVFNVDTTNKLISINPLSGTGDVALNVEGGIDQTGMTTPNSGASPGQWTRLGICTIDEQFQHCMTVLNIVGGYDGASGSNTQATVSARVKQQNALGGAPLVNLTLNDTAEVITKDDLKIVVTQNDGTATVAELWGRVTNNFELWHFTPVLNTNSYDNRWVWSPGTAFQAALPAGTQTAARYGNSFANTLLVQPSTDSATALQVQKADATPVLTVDTTTSRVGIGGSFTPQQALDVMGNVQIRDAASATKAYRFRTSGSSLDLEAAGASLVISNWTGADFTGTQRNYLVLESSSHTAQAVGTWQWRTSANGTTRHIIDGTTGAGVVFNENAEATDFRIEGDTDANAFFLQGSTDRVGVGTNSPAAKLHVSSAAAAPLFRVTDATATAADVLNIADEGAATFQNRTNSTSAFRVLNAGSGELIGTDTTNSIVRLLSNNTAALGSFQTAANDLNDIGAGNDREGGNSVVVGGYVYYLGGCGGGVAQTTTYYARLNNDGSTGAWATTGAIPQATCNNAVTTYNGYIYVNGGTGNSTNSRNVYYARPNADGTISSWSTASQVMPSGQAKRRHAMVAYNGRLYIIGGGLDTAGTQSNKVHMGIINADGSVGTMAETGTNWLNSNGGDGNMAVVANGYLYVRTATAVTYGKIAADGTIGTLGTVDSDNLSSSRAYGPLVAMNGYLYSIGGDSDSNTVSYSPLNSDGSIGAWTNDTASLMPANRANCGGVVKNGYIYCIAGYSGSAETGTVFYTSGTRVTVGGSLDLLANSGENMAEGGSGGELTAGNTNIVGTLTVSGNANFKDGAIVNNNFAVNGFTVLRTATDSTTAFQMLNAAGTQMFSIDTTNSYVYIGNQTVDSTGALLILDTKNTTGDPTNTANGAMYYNSFLGEFRCYQAGAWRECMEPSSLSWGYEIKEDFMGGHNTGTFSTMYGWGEDFGGTGGTAGGVLLDVGSRPGQAQLSTGTANNGYSFIYHNNNVSANGEPIIVSGGEEIEMAINIATLADGTNDYDIRLGLCDTTGDCENGVYFEYDRDVSTNWRYAASANNGANRTEASSTTAVQTGWHRYKIVVNSNATAASFYVDGALIGTMNTAASMPTANTTQPGFLIQKEAGGTARTMKIDYFHLRQTISAQR